MELTSSTEYPYSNYTEYIQKLEVVQPEFQWLSAFLTTESPKPPETRVLIFESENGALSVTEVEDISRPNLLHAIIHPKSSYRTRLIVVMYPQTWSIDRQVIDAIGTAYNVDPMFFWQTLDHFYAKNDRLCPEAMRSRINAGTLWTFPLPSEQRFLDACYIDAGLNAVLFRGGRFQSSGDRVPGGGFYGVILLRDPMKCLAGATANERLLPQHLRLLKDSEIHHHENTLGHRYLDILERLSEETVSSMDDNPVEYTYPYYHLLAVEVFSRLQRQSFFLEQQYYEGLSARAQTQALEEGWAILHDTRLYMTNTQKSLEQFAVASSSPSSKEVLRDYEVLMKQIDIVQSDLRDYLNRHVAMLALEDSKKSLEQAVTMNGLTKLAFVFLPLSFMTSLFGMNLTLFGSGTVELWMFVVAAVVLFALVMGASIVALRPAHSALEATDAVEVTANSPGSPNQEPIRTLLRIATLSLREAFWLLIFMASNPWVEVRAFCQTINTNVVADWKERDRNDYPNPPPKSISPYITTASDGGFWSSRARRMNKLLHPRESIEDN